MLLPLSRQYLPFTVIIDNKRHFPRLRLWFLGQYFSNRGLWTLGSPRHVFSRQRAYILVKFEWETKVRGSWRAGNLGSGYLLSLLSLLPRSQDDLLFPEVGGDLGNIRTFPRKMSSRGGLPGHGRTPAPVFCNVALIEITLTLWFHYGEQESGCRNVPHGA